MAQKDGHHTGTLICTDDVSDGEKLQSIIEQLEATSEELSWLRRSAASLSKE